MQDEAVPSVDGLKVRLLNMQTAKTFTINLAGQQGRDKLAEAVGQTTMSHNSGDHGHSRTTSNLMIALHGLHCDPDCKIVLVGLAPAVKLHAVRDAFIQQTLKIQFFPAPATQEA